MIFYFTGTGNSQYVAQSLAKEGERLISIVECLRNDKYDFDTLGFEPVGIVCPVYFGGLPMAVIQFLEKLELSEKPAYLYGVLTYGGFAAGAGNMMKVRSLPAPGKQRYEPNRGILQQIQRGQASQIPPWSGGICGDNGEDKRAA